MSMKPESVFRTGRVMPFLKTLKNSFFFPIQQSAINGDPDIIGCMSGLFVCIELKSKGEKPRPLQEYKLSEVTRTHGVALVADPDNWELIKKQLRKLDRGEDT